MAKQSVRLPWAIVVPYGHFLASSGTNYTELYMKISTNILFADKKKGFGLSSLVGTVRVLTLTSQTLRCYDRLSLYPSISMEFDNLAKAPAGSLTKSNLPLPSGCLGFALRIAERTKTAHSKARKPKAIGSPISLKQNSLAPTR
jgi:hypothetical protein